jgi:hypothetical protein
MRIARWSLHQSKAHTKMETSSFDFLDAIRLGEAVKGRQSLSRNNGGAHFDRAPFNTCLGFHAHTKVTGRHDDLLSTKQPNDTSAERKWRFWRWDRKGHECVCLYVCIICCMK